MMKNRIYSVLALASLAGFAACANEETEVAPIEETTPAAEAPATTTVPTVPEGEVQPATDPATDPALDATVPTDTTATMPQP